MRQDAKVLYELLHSKGNNTLSPFRLYSNM